MGSIINHNIEHYIDNFNLNVFVETGTGLGNSFAHAQKFSFKKLYTIEMIFELYQYASTRLKRHDSVFIHSKSKSGLVSCLELIDRNSKILFWLDAHFPGADFGLQDYSSTFEKEVRIPLQDELKEIKMRRDCRNDVFIIDDLRIYEDGPFEDGNWSDRPTLGGNNIDFIYELFEKTHLITKDYRDQGYVILTPKNQINPLLQILCTQ